MNPHIDYIARCIDNAIYIGLGVCVLSLLPVQIKRGLESGKMTLEKAKTASKLRLPCGCLMIAYGLFKIFVG
jgi:hypothetical protein